MDKYKVAIIIILFIMGILFMAKHSMTKTNTLTPSNNNCPTTLVQEGAAYYLYTSSAPKKEGVNPLKFNNLEEYNEFIDLQRSKGIHCPVLFVQKTQDAQGETGYKARPSPTDLQGGLPPKLIEEKHNYPPETKLNDAGHSFPLNNVNSYPGFDPMNQYIGQNTPLDKMYNDTQNIFSPNPMDANWGGPDYTQSAVDAGIFNHREVDKSRQ
jgi:hypothetical protein